MKRGLRKSDGDRDLRSRKQTGGVSVQCFMQRGPKVQNKSKCAEISSSQLWLSDASSTTRGGGVHPALSRSVEKLLIQSFIHA